MFVKAMYNNIANNYNIADYFGGITLSHKCAIKQITQQVPNKNNLQILDLGVGDGAFIAKLNQIIENAKFTGIDLSKEMLKQAKNLLEFTAIEGSATNATRYLQASSQDLVMAHFINAYMSTDDLFNEAQILTKEDGYFSVISTTYESFPASQKFFTDFIAKGTLLSSIVGHYYKQIVKKTPVALGEQDLLRFLEQHKFAVLEHERIKIDLSFQNIDELALFGIEGAWFLNALSISKIIPKSFLLKKMKRLLSKIFTFPYHDTHVIDVILAQKKSI